MIINSGNLTTLHRAFNASFRDGFGMAPSQHEVLMMGTRSTTSIEEYGWLGQFPSMREWVGERVMRAISEHGYSIINKKYEATVEVSRDKIEDDQYGVYAPLFTEMGRAAATHPCQLVFGALKNGFSEKCYDGQNFFDADHDVQGSSVSNTGGGSGSIWVLADCSRNIKPIVFQMRRPYHMQYMDMLNDEHVFQFDRFRYGVDARVNVGYGLWQLAYGSKQELNVTNYETARTALMNMKGDEDRPLGIMPTHLFCGPSTEKDALELLNADRLANGATNVYRGTAKLVATPWLS